MACRTFSLAVCGLTMSVRLVNYVISEMENNSARLALSPTHAFQTFQTYVELEIVLSLAYDITARASAWLMTVGLSCSVMFNFFTIGLHRAIPFPLYLYFPSVAGMIPFVIDALLPVAINVYENGCKIKCGWERSIASFSWCNKKWLRRRVRAVRPVRIYAGILGYNFFWLKRETKSTYYSTIVEVTIDALLSMQ